MILPHWYMVLGELNLEACMMPQDVSTWWNSTYDMLKFTLTYQDALDTITSEKEMKLQKYKLDEEEWEITSQLRDVLKVSLFPSCSHLI